MLRHSCDATPSQKESVQQGKQPIKSVLNRRLHFASVMYVLPSHHHAKLLVSYAKYADPQTVLASRAVCCHHTSAAECYFNLCCIHIISPKELANCNCIKGDNLHMVFAS